MNSDGASNRPPRTPLNWPTVAFGLGVLGFAGVALWLLCDVIGQALR